VSRSFIVAANWKMNKGPIESVEFLSEFFSLFTKWPKCEIVIFPPAIDLVSVARMIEEKPLRWGAQNCHFEDNGAFTGENSPKVIAELGADYTLVGHSERRKIFGEIDEMLAKKIVAVQRHNMIPMLCVGEELSERESGKTNLVITEQLKKGLSQANLETKIVLAYEPVWAIGTGKVATPEQAEDAHAVLRKMLIEIGGESLSERTPILYGGSVKPENAAELSKKPNIDGFLVGGAALAPASYAGIIKNSQLAF